MDNARSSLLQAIKTRILEDLENALKFAIGVQFTDNQLIREAKKARHEEIEFRGEMEDICASNGKGNSVWRYLHHDNRRRIDNALSGRSNEKFRSCLRMKRRIKRSPILEKPKSVEQIMNEMKSSDITNSTNIDGYAQIFDFGKYNIDIERLNADQGAHHQCAMDGIQIRKLKQEMNALKREAKLVKAKCKKYKDNYQRLKRKLERKPYDQRLNEHTLVTREKVKEYSQTYAKLVQQIKSIQFQMGKITNSLADHI